MFPPDSHTRRRALGWLAGVCLPAAAHEAPRFLVQTEPSLAHASALIEAALGAAGFAATFQETPNMTEQRNLHEGQKGNVHLSLLPTTPDRLALLRKGKLRLIPIPLERGLLGWRACFVARQDADKLAGVRDLNDLRRFVIGQGNGWWNAQIYRAAGITTREMPNWRDGQFFRQMALGQIDLFPMGLEESLNYFLPHFQLRYPGLVLDRHLLLQYPWYRALWVSAHPDADRLYAALQTGFDRIVHSGEFERLWNRLRPLPAPAAWQGRTVIALKNPWFGPELIAPKYRHLLLQPALD